LEEKDLAGVEPDKTLHLEQLLDRYFEKGSSRPGARAEGKMLGAILDEKGQVNQRRQAVFEMTPPRPGKK
jgi:hypothetical protein